MFHTATSGFSIEHSPYGSDITRQFVEAVSGEGLRVGLYYSLSDWHHPDYPAFTEESKP
jgi:alpha-L-fucosidase